MGLKINHEKINEDNARTLVELCPFKAISYNDGKLDISAACRVCKMCVNKGPAGVITFEEEKVEEESLFGETKEEEKAEEDGVSDELFGFGKSEEETPEVEKTPEEKAEEERKKKEEELLKQERLNPEIINKDAV